MISSVRSARNVPKLDRRIPYEKPREIGTIQFWNTTAYLVLAGEKKILIAEADLLETAKGGARRFTVANGIVLHYDPESRELSALGSSSGKWIVIPGYWFALTAFHPDAHRIGPEGLEWATTAGAGGPNSG